VDQPRRHLKEAGSQRSPILFSYLCVHPWWTTKFDINSTTCVGRGDYLGISHASHLKTAEFQCSPILGVLLCFCLHPLTQNDQIWHGDTYGDWPIFRRSAMPLHLQKCVERFVSDSWSFCSSCQWSGLWPLAISVGSRGRWEFYF